MEVCRKVVDFGGRGKVWLSQARMRDVGESAKFENWRWFCARALLETCSHISWLIKIKFGRLSLR